MTTPLPLDHPIRELTGFDRTIIEDNMRKTQIYVKRFKQYNDGAYVQEFVWETVKEVRV